MMAWCARIDAMQYYRAALRELLFDIGHDIRATGFLSENTGAAWYYFKRAVAIPAVLSRSIITYRDYGREMSMTDMMTDIEFHFKT